MILTILLWCIGIWTIGGMIIYVIDFFTTRLLFFDWEKKLQILNILLSTAIGIGGMLSLWIMCFLLNPPTSKSKQLWQLNPENTGSL